MSGSIHKLISTASFFFFFLVNAAAQNIAEVRKIMKQEYNLTPNPSKDTQYYAMESRLQKQALDGSIQGIDIYRLYLRCVPSADPAQGDEYTCLKFLVQLNNTAEISIPSLANWKHYFLVTANARDKNGQVFGIEHKIFEKLKDENGKMLPLENTYHVYNAFIDFHAMNVFADKTKIDSGVQNLKTIGDKIVHAASYSKAPVNLGPDIAEGSYFKNGLVTLSFKGLGLINDKVCAILEYDSGKSSFFMIMKPIASMEVPTTGSSHYWGDIYKDLGSGWIQKAVLHEIVISETTVPGMSNKINTVIERSIDIENMKK